MLHLRLIVGSLLVALAAGTLVLDQRLAHWHHPFLFLLMFGLALAACHELLALLGPTRRPAPGLCYLGVAALLGANWLTRLAAVEPWPYLAGAFAGVVLLAFAVEMAAYHAPGESVNRIALAVWVVAYLGLLPCFLAQVRWLPGKSEVERSVALALALFIPKCCDTGAYFTGRLLGRHKMTPVLSPGKTWEGAAGGVVLAVLATWGIDRLAPVVPGGLPGIVGFGITLGVVAIVGDLAESLVKRDCRQKDASQTMPGFGGVLDVVDSIVFAAPVAYWLLRAA